MGITHGDSPIECIEFCTEQYKRFNISLPTILSEIVEAGAALSLYYLDCIDPYTMFQGLTDVDITTDWSEFAYEVIEGAGRVWEPDPSSVETFKFVPGQDEETFIQIMGQPGLEALPLGIGHQLKEYMSEGEEYGIFSPSDTVSVDALRALDEVCGGNKNIKNAYYELAAWAAVAWLLGPPSRSFRMNYHDIYHTVLNHGEAIMVDGCVIPPHRYRKLQRPPRSCMKCGLASWCVEMTASISGTRYICESCLSEGMPPSPMATCGSKRCLLAECPHHPFHNMGTAGLGQAYRNYGQLGAAARGTSAIHIKGGRQPLLYGGQTPIF